MIIIDKRFNKKHYVFYYINFFDYEELNFSLKISVHEEIFCENLYKDFYRPFHIWKETNKTVKHSFGYKFKYELLRFEHSINIISK